MTKRMKPQFLLVSKDKESTTEILNTLSFSKSYEILIAGSLNEAMHLLATNSIKCVIFDIPTFTLKSIKFINKLREMYQEPPFMIISYKIQKEAFDSACKIDRVVMLERTFLHEELPGICEKIVTGREIMQRKFKRFATDQIVEIERMVTGEVFRGFAFNLSQGGAYITIENGSVAPGDILRVGVRLDKVGKLHVLFGKVIWVMQNPINKLNPRAGVRFVPAEFVYSSLLETVK
ncbi:MAG: PilZ domain-containing protein [Oligoflexia bacterium]|nr:PilZ domain-containing protein [Oligoflexia bacterium]